MSATVKYANGVAAVFASQEEAAAQAAHDASFPGHVNPAYIVEGDHSERHQAWDTLTPPSGETVVDARSLVCDCAQCEFQRRAPSLAYAERAELLDKLQGKRFAPIAGGAVPGAGFGVTFTAVALTAATAKTVLGVLTGSNTPVDVVEFSISGDAGSGNLLIELVYGTNASNAPGTNSTSFTPLLIRGPAQTLNATAGVTWTTEPTVLTVVKRWRMPWPGGPFLLQAPLGRELNSITTAATSGKLVGIRLTSSVASNSDGYLELEE